MCLCVCPQYRRFIIKALQLRTHTHIHLLQSSTPACGLARGPAPSFLTAGSTAGGSALNCAAGGASLNLHTVLHTERALPFTHGRIKHFKGTVLELREPHTLLRGTAGLSVLCGCVFDITCSAGGSCPVWSVCVGPFSPSHT